jgi:tetratricopeptide (TPR) repeat protein
MAHRQTKHWRSTWTFYEYALSLFPHPYPPSWIAYYGYGAALYKRERLGPAKAAFLEALRLEPKDAQTHFDLGLIYKKEGLEAAAFDEYRTAVSLNPDMVDALVNLGIALFQRGDAPAGLRLLDRAVMLRPLSALAQYNRGVLLRFLGRHDEARQSLLKAASIDPALGQRIPAEYR